MNYVGSRVSNKQRRFEAGLKNILCLFTNVSTIYCPLLIIHKYVFYSSDWFL